MKKLSLAGLVFLFSLGIAFGEPLSNYWNNFSVKEKAVFLMGFCNGAEWSSAVFEKLSDGVAVPLIHVETCIRKTWTDAEWSISVFDRVVAEFPGLNAFDVYQKAIVIILNETKPIDD